jgi:hypothetical protein
LKQRPARLEPFLLGYDGMLHGVPPADIQPDNTG